MRKMGYENIEKAIAEAMEWEKPRQESWNWKNHEMEEPWEKSQDGEKNMEETIGEATYWEKPWEELPNP